MALSSARNLLYFCTMLIVSLASITTALTLEELNSEMQKLKKSNGELSLAMQQLKRNNTHLNSEIRLLKQKNVRLQWDMHKLKRNDTASKEELQLKVQQLESAIIEQRVHYMTLHNEIGSLVKENANNLLGKLTNKRNAIFRTCRELLLADPSLESGMYWIDPDGHGVGDDPIYVECDMAAGKTSVLHDSENPTNVSRCADPAHPGCYERAITYSASMQQMNALADLSIECHQSIKYDCNFAPLETNGVAQSWWYDKHGSEQYFWSGSNKSIHTCQCGINKDCIDRYHLCNCDAGVPTPRSDIGVITDKNYLPITQLNFGRTQFETSLGVHTLGRFECTGKVVISGMPKSCGDLWKIGHTLSGIYLIMGSKHVETVHCDFTIKPHNKQGLQTFIGYSDVKSSPVYFFVQKNAPHKTTGRIPFEITQLNVGAAMDTGSGIFTAPRSGVYSFAFSGVGRHPNTWDLSVIRIVLVLNWREIAKTVTSTDDDPSFFAMSLHATLYLNPGDRVWLSIHSLEAKAHLHDDPYSPSLTQFTGYLLHEDVGTSFSNK